MTFISLLLVFLWIEQDTARHILLIVYMKVFLFHWLRNWYAMECWIWLCLRKEREREHMLIWIGIAIYIHGIVSIQTRHMFPCSTDWGCRPWLPFGGIIDFKFIVPYRFDIQAISTLKSNRNGHQRKVNGSEALPMHKYIIPAVKNADDSVFHIEKCVTTIANTSLFEMYETIAYIVCR